MSSNDVASPCTCPRPHPGNLRHGDIEGIFPDIFFVQGTVEIKGAAPFTMKFQRSMTIVRQGQELTLYNTVRLDEAGLGHLDALGEVKHVVRLAFFHGMDDPFYKDRYPNVTVWSPENAPYFPEFNVKATPYMIADKVFSSKNATLPFGAKAILIESAKFPEALALLELPDIGKVMITGDSLQNFERGDPHADCCTSLIMRLMGFYKPCNVGPAWFAQAKPAKHEMVALLEHKFDHVLPCHGVPCLGRAHEKFASSIYALK